MTTRRSRVTTTRTDTTIWLGDVEAIDVSFYYDILDMNGDTVFDPLPGYSGRDLTVRLRGRDTHTDWLEPEFDQYIILNGIWELHNSFLAADYGRWTAAADVTFYFRMVR